MATISRAGGRILLTGAGGFIGANLARYFCDKFEVHAVVRDKTKLWRISKDYNSLVIHEGNLTNTEVADKIIEDLKPEIVMHFAAHPALSEENDEKTIILDTVSPLINLVASCRKTDSCKVFINAGSSSEYGYQTNPMREDMVPNPTSVHGIAKLAQTMYGVYASRFYNLPIINLRLFSVYGPLEHGRRLIPRLMMASLKGIPASLSSPEIARDFIYIEDVIRAVEHCLMLEDSWKGQIYNIGTGIQHTIMELVSSLEQIHGEKIPVVWGGKQPNKWDTSTWVADTKKTKTELDFRPVIDWKDGLQKTYDWFSDNISNYVEYQT